MTQTAPTSHHGTAVQLVRQASGLSIPTRGIIADAITYPGSTEMSAAVFSPELCEARRRSPRTTHVAQASRPARKLYAPPRATSEASC